MNAETIGRLPAPVVGTTTKHLSHWNHVPPSYAPPINGKENKRSIQILGGQWDQPAMHPRGSDFFLFGGGRVVFEFFVVLLKFYICSHHTLSFPPKHVRTVPNVFPTAPAFVQDVLPSDLPGSYIGESILRVTCFYEYLYLGGVSQVSQGVFWAMWHHPSGWLQTS